MRILVTGGAGFIASNIVDEYVSLGHEVAVLDNLSTGKRKNLNDEAIFYEKDIREDLSDIFREFKPDAVNHHAAQIDVRKSISDPRLDYDVNVRGSLNILENCLKYPVSKIVFASSGGAVYGDPESLPATEETMPNPLSPYGKDKHRFEEILAEKTRGGKLSYSCLRYSNVYGPRQDPLGEAGVVAIFTRKLLDGEKAVIFGDGTQTRDYVYVDDVVAANALALEYDGDARAFNVGVGVETSVNEIAEILKTEIGTDSEIVHAPPVEGEVKRICLDCSLAEKELGWTAKTGIRKGIRKTVEWAGPKD